MNRAMIEPLNCNYLLTKCQAPPEGIKKLDAALNAVPFLIVVGKASCGGTNFPCCVQEDALQKVFPASVPGNFSCGNRCRQRKTHDTGGTAGAEGGGTHHRRQTYGGGSRL